MKRKLLLVLDKDRIVAGYLDPAEEAAADRLVTGVAISKTKTWCG